MGNGQPLSGAVVRVAGVDKRYGPRPAVRGASFAVQRGELYGVIGPDAAGKSSLFKIVAGVLAQDAGEVEVFGRRIDSERTAERVKDRLGFMPQGLGLNLYPELTVEENIDFFARLRMVPPAALAERKSRLLATTRLERFRERPMKNLSGGMKQKLGLVCSLIHEPELVILDEPTTGVDPLSRRDFWRILAELLKAGRMTALVSTAYLDEASRFDRVSLMYAGRMIAAGEPEALRRELAAVVVRAPAPRDGTLPRIAGRFLHVDRRGDGISVLVAGHDRAGALAQVRDALGLVDAAALEADEPELEDLFIARTRQSEAAPPALPAGAKPAAAGQGYAIEADGLSRDFGAFRAVDRVSFRVARGEIFGLLGANGAGKTTVVKMLTGILRPSEGVGQVAGVDMRSARRAIRQRIGYMSQAFSLYTDLSVAENLLLYAGIYGLSGREARRESARVVELAGLGAHLRDAAGDLPMGLRQRLALGCALVHAPPVLFLDEPTSGVDPLGRRHFWNILFWLAREQAVTVLVTTHHMSEAELCDRLVLMYDGRVVADAPPGELVRAAQEETGPMLEVRTDAPAAALEALAAAGAGEPMLHGRAVRLPACAGWDADRIASVLARHGIRVGSVVPRDLTMEDVFVRRVAALQQAAQGRP